MLWTHELIRKKSSGSLYKRILYPWCGGKAVTFYRFVHTYFVTEHQTSASPCWRNTHIKCGWWFHEKKDTPRHKAGSRVSVFCLQGAMTDSWQQEWVGRLHLLGEVRHDAFHLQQTCQLMLVSSTGLPVPPVVTSKNNNKTLQLSPVLCHSQL